MMKRMILALAVVTALGVSGPAQAASFVGGQTDVIFDAGAAGLFASVAPLGTATQNGLTFTFPVTGGTDSPLSIEHNGSGIELGSSATSDLLELRNFLIDGTSLTVFGDAFLGGALVATGADLFTVVPDATLGLRLALTGTSASVLSGFLDTSLQAGLQIATAVPQPRVPEPASILLMGSALALVLRRRLR
jgi:hypothetical protein